ncbi:MAG: exo-alpha-sialidase [Planctomycetes bacterium]|nr:exo-alpha-sialidase [Planctomycetota bacterium]
MMTNGSWMKLLFLGVPVFLGGALGLYLATDFDGPTFIPSSCCNHSELKGGSKSFPLEQYDVKDTQERPSLAVDGKGRIYLAWASQTSDSDKALLLARSDDQGESFNSAKEVIKSGIFKAISQMKGKTISRDVRMTPHVIGGKEDVFLAWTESLPDLKGVRMVVASSKDAGETFGNPIPVHHGENARATFTSISVGQDGTMVSSWLDNRDKKQKTFASVKGPFAPEFTPEETVAVGDLEKGVCPCCPTSTLVALDGTVYVAFRNIKDGYRDFYISKKKPGAASFEPPVSIISPTWKFDGCPHDGASMVLSGETLHITWMDARSGSQRCYHAIANCNEMKFTATELHPMIQGSQGNARLAMDSKGDVHAVWEESKDAAPVVDGGAEHKHGTQDFSTGVGRNIMVATFEKVGKKFGNAKTVDGKSGVFQTRPAIAVAQNGDLLIAWNELSEAGKAIKFKRVQTAAIVAKDSKP